MEEIMEEQTFIYQYDPITNEWYELLPDAEEDPIVLLADIFWGEREGAYSHPAGDYAEYMNPDYQNYDWSYFNTSLHQRLVWCPKHRCFERIWHLERKDSIRSVVDCRMQGKMAGFTAEIDVSGKEDTKKTVTAPVRWAVKQCADGSIDIQADIIHIPMLFHAADSSISLDTENIDSCRVTLCETFRVGGKTVKFSPDGKDWQDFNLDIPERITEQAVSCLLSKAGHDAYIPPDSNTSGFRKLRAFAARPGELHMEYWLKILGRAFGMFIPKQGKNLFLELCRFLRLEPTVGLVEGYEKNPFAPLWAVLLRGWGFKNEETIKHFFPLAEFAGIAPNHFRITGSSLYGKEVYFYTEYRPVNVNAWDDRESQETIAESILEERFHTLETYVRWLLTQTDEDHAGRVLFHLASRPWTEEIKEVLDSIPFLTGDELMGAEEIELSAIAKRHLLGCNTEWRGSHFLAEHEIAMRELDAIKALHDEREKEYQERLENEEAELEREERLQEDETRDEDLGRTLRLLAAFRKLLQGEKLFARDYPVPSMLFRDMKVLCTVEPNLVHHSREGYYIIAPLERRYNTSGEIVRLSDRSRKSRLLAYVRHLQDCGFLSRDIADKISGREIPRRTFVRDLSILRRAFPDKELIYRANTKCYVWEEVDENESC